MKLITLSNLQSFKTKLDGLFVAKELKTGSDSEYRTLSDNNLTDELVEKINNAGAAAEVTEDIAAAKSEAVTESKSYTDTAKTEAVTESKSYTDETASTAKTEAIESSNSYTDTKAGEALTEAKSYADAAETDAVATSKTYTDEQVDAAKTELQADINSKISTAYKAKGSVAFASLPELSADAEGNVYNVIDGFETTADFVEGEGQAYPAGTNVVCVEESEGAFKWDVLPGFIDTDSFVLSADIETVSEDDINAMFAA